MSILGARLWRLFAASIVALALQVAGTVQYFCHGMGRVVAKCCCPRTTTVQSTEDLCGSKIQARDCCERLERGDSAAPALRDRASSLEAPRYPNIHPDRVRNPPSTSPEDVEAGWSS